MMAITNRALILQLQKPQSVDSYARLIVDLADRADNDPYLQQVLRKIELPPPFDVLEYRKRVKGRGYWVRKPYTRQHPTRAWLEANLQFSRVNHALYGVKGTVELEDGRRIPRPAYVAGKLVEGTRFTTDGEIEERYRERTMDRILESVAVSEPEIAASTPRRRAIELIQEYK